MIALAKKLLRSSKSKPEEPQWESAPAFAPLPRDTKIRMIQTIRGSVNGWAVQEFKAGKIYKVTKSLADSLVGMSAATKI